MSWACCLSQVFQLHVDPHCFCFRNLHFQFCLHVSAAAWLEPLLLTAKLSHRQIPILPGKGKDTFHSLVPSILSSLENVWSYVGKAVCMAVIYTNPSPAPNPSNSPLPLILQYQVRAAAWLSLQFLIAQQVNNFLYFCSRTAEEVTHICGTLSAHLNPSALMGYFTCRGAILLSFCSVHTLQQ